MICNKLKFQHIIEVDLSSACKNTNYTCVDEFLVMDTFLRTNIHVVLLHIHCDNYLAGRAI